MLDTVGTSSLLGWCRDRVEGPWPGSVLADKKETEERSSAHAEENWKRQRRQKGLAGAAFRA
jgi:hypothetical protein